MADTFADVQDPPTPTRVVESKSSIIPGRGSLSTLTGEVVEAQKYQLTELSAKQNQLAQIQEEINSAKQSHDLVQSELMAKNRQLFFVQDDVGQLEKSCAKYKKNITELLEEKKKLTTESIDTSFNDRQGTELYGKYRDKMTSFEEKMAAHLKGTEQGRLLQELRANVARDEKKLSLLQDEQAGVAKRSAELEREICAAREREKELDLEVGSVENTLEKERKNKVMLEKEIDALYKRNAGQMNRLKRQLNEARMRADRWHLDNEKLQERIEVLEKQLNY